MRTLAILLAACAAPVLAQGWQHYGGDAGGRIDRLALFEQIEEAVERRDRKLGEDRDEGCP